MESFARRRKIRMVRRLATLAVLVLAGAAAPSWAGSAEEFCLQGELNLGARLQGTYPETDEFYPTAFCVITEPEGNRVRFHGQGRSNPDMDGSFTVDYLPPDEVRIVAAEGSPDTVFRGADMMEEARRNRRIDPVRLFEELQSHPDWIENEADGGWLRVQYPGEPFATRVRIADARVQEVHTLADVPLRGRVAVHWGWKWADGSDQPELELTVDGDVMFRARGQRRLLNEADAGALWLPGSAPPREVPGAAWPARTDMKLETLAEGVHRVNGVRTGFSHLVVETGQGLVVADAPAGWVEMQQLPPADLVPGLGISGLSERFIDFLVEHWPDQPVRAVAISHAHDDHAGGARAFAAAGAEGYAPAAVADFLEAALNSPEMPDDRLSARGGRVTVRPVGERLVLEDALRGVALLDLGGSPHVAAAMGVWVPDAGLVFQSDLHVPRGEDDHPRADRAATECWFAGWAVAHLPPDARVLNSHSAGLTPVSRLQRYTQSEACSTQ